MRFKSLRNHARAVASSFQTHLPFFKSFDTELSLRGYAQLRENRRYVINLITKMMIANLQMSEESPLLQEWRKKSPTQAMVTRILINVLCEEKGVTLNELTYRCETFASRESVRACVNQGIDLGLVYKDGKKYCITETLAEELFFRSVIRMRHKDVVEFAHFCSSFDNIERLQKKSPYDRQDGHPLNSDMTLSEALESGQYSNELSSKD